MTSRHPEPPHVLCFLTLRQKLSGIGVSGIGVSGIGVSGIGVSGIGVSGLGSWLKLEQKE
jgi:hypothetical protein